MQSYLNILLITGIVLLLIKLSWTDIKARVISNNIIIILLVLVIPLAYLLHDKIFFLSSLVALFIGFFLFNINVIGAGDVKLISVLMLAIPLEQIFSFLFLTSIFGLLLIIIGWIFFKESIKKNGLPYGVAISSGFFLNFLLFNLT